LSTENPSAFAAFGLLDSVLQAVEEIGYETPSPIQAAVIEPLLAGKDIFGQAQTGTGKTAAFALPLLSRLDLTQAHPQVLVLTPTRELAIQVAEAFQTYARHLKGFHVLPIYGGQAIGLQLRPLRRGVHVVVGTPGRVTDHLRRGTLDLSRIRSFVLDEADEMLRMGFKDDVEGILAAAPKERQLALFSATMPEPVKAIARRHAHDAIEVRIKARTSTVETITQRYWQVSGVQKLDALTRLLETEDFDAMAVFVRTKTATTFLAERLEARGFSCSALNGDMNQAAREQTIERLKSGALDILVATDVAARGLDVERISHVINYDIPYDTEAYVHRVGRTGRAGREGHAIVFVAPRERNMLRSIERATGQAITAMQLPTHADVANKRTSRFKEKLAHVMENEKLDYYESVVHTYQQEHGSDVTRIAAALMYMAQGKNRLAPDSNSTPGRESKPSGGDNRAPRPSRETRVPRESREPREARRPRDDDMANSRPPRSPEKREPRPSSEAEDRYPAPRFNRDAAGSDDDRIRYRIEVGSEHGVQPKNIVGAIANEAGLASREIGPIKIHETFTLVTLPGSMPKEVLSHLKRVWICNVQLRMSVDDGTTPPPVKGKLDSKPAGKPMEKTTGKPRPKPKSKSDSKAKSKSKGKPKSKAAKRLVANSGSASTKPAPKQP
jgi:ATP-dependent RNA helicase DeaD